MSSLALSTSWNSARHQEGEPMLEEMRSLGFTRAELSHGIRYSLWPGILQAVENKIITIGSLHNFCPLPVEVSGASPNCYQFSDERPHHRMAAVRHTILTIENAVTVGAQAVVLHLGWAGPDRISRQLERAFVKGKFLRRAFVRTKIQAVQKRREVFSKVYGRVKNCLDKIVETAIEHKIQLGFECREEFEEFPHEGEMARVIQDYPRETVGYWHDFGHAARKQFLTWHDHAETLRERHDRLIGCHIHDCAAPDHDHLALGQGEIDFPALVPLLPADCRHVLEFSPRITTEEVASSKEIWESLVNASV